MKKLLVILFAAGMLVSCGDGAKNSTSGANTDENVEDNSGEIVTPQPDDSVGVMDSDTLSMERDSIR
jgi:hypothetical protein